MFSSMLLNYDSALYLMRKSDIFCGNYFNYRSISLVVDNFLYYYETRYQFYILSTTSTAIVRNQSCSNWLLLLEIMRGVFVFLCCCGAHAATYVVVTQIVFGDFSRRINYEFFLLLFSTNS